MDPDWAENLNSVLDDNRLLTLPSGERLAIPPNVRLLLEVDSLQYATPATVSRCGMVWFSADTLTDEMLLTHHLAKLKTAPVALLEGGGGRLGGDDGGGGGSGVQAPLAQTLFVEAIEPYVLGGGGGGEEGGGLVKAALHASLAEAAAGHHVMETERARLLETFFSLLGRGVALAIEYDEAHPEGDGCCQIRGEHMEKFATRWLLFAALWGLGSSLSGARREALAALLARHSPLPLPPSTPSLLDLQVRVEDGEWVEWAAAVPRLEIEAHRVVSSDVVVPTTDTLRHVEVLRAWLASHKPLLLCGPPGSGKTMTLTSTLQAMPNIVLASLNFSSGTGPDLLLKTFAQYGEYVRTPRGLVLQPAASLGGEEKWLVIFCDEINLPETDKYGTQRVLAFLRQLTEAGGFWRAQDNCWVTLHRIQFVGACNPPTDTGRVPLSLRFLRHAPLLLVDFPTRPSLRQIYRTFNAALLKLQPGLAGYIDPLTDAMLDFYGRNQARFTPDVKPQYVYSPRELSRWVRALYEAIAPLEGALLGPQLVRVWAHEALRLFHDRLTTEDEREWCQATLDEVAAVHFPLVGPEAEALARPILYSKWLSKHFQSVQREELRAFVAARLKVFYEEELDVPLVIFDDVLEHVLRIDGVLQQPMGHLLLVGESGVGKTVLSRFVSWMNGLSVFQVKASFQYTLDRFDDDLRAVLKRAGTTGEKICFIFDESNALSSAFLERMNALLASGEVPGLFEGDEYQALMAACRSMGASSSSSSSSSFSSSSSASNPVAESEEELYRRFVRNVQRNLHVVFTMNPAGADFDTRCTTSPALFNRCVVDWFGSWSPYALAQVAFEFTMSVDLGGGTLGTYKPPTAKKGRDALLETVRFLYDADGVDEEEEEEADSGKRSRSKKHQPTIHHAVIAALVAAHEGVKRAVERVGKKGRRHYLSPRDFLDLIRNFVSVVGEKRAQLEEQQLHINIGLEKLAATQTDVAALQKDLAHKKEELKGKDTLANAKLQQMVGDQNEAERRKADADQVSVELANQNAAIATRRAEVETELAEAEPALVAAQGAVKSIKKAQLDEVRVLARPPNAVRLTLEAVLILLGEEKGDWNDVRKVIRRDDFIATVVNFDPESITPRQIKDINENYVSLEEFEYEAVNRASKACGPLNKWVVSLVQYSTILRRVQPLRDEVTALQAESDVLQSQQDKIVAQITHLESSIARYKSEYAEAIREIEAIKAEMDAVAAKVKRAESLLASLASEKDRWHETSASFQRQLASLVGDALLSAAFLTYAGIFDHRSRRLLLEEWAASLDALNVPFRPDLSPTDYLSRPAQQLEWQSHGLPTDQLCVENAIVLERAKNRYPLVIDPSGHATQFLLSKYATRKVQTTSFADGGFLKTLASAVRFGTPLIIQDVEAIDPILNPVLNKELQRTGGRTLLRLGNEDIDFSPQFVVIMVTRNPSARLSPDLCSRVTLVNFTVTPASLCSQALSQVLRAERPDVDRRRTEVLRLQGEQNVKLRELEEGLLNELSAVQGNILDDDRVLRVLETLKAEAAEVGKDVASTQEVMAELKATSDVYEPLALAVTQIYFLLERLAEVHFLYQFPIQYLLSILGHVIATHPPPKAAAKPQERLDTLKTAFFAEVCRRVSKGLLQEDQLAFAVRLTQVYLEGEGKKEDKEEERGKLPSDEELEFFYKGAPAAAAGMGGKKEEDEYLIPGVRLEEGQAKELRALSTLPSLAPLLDSIRSNGKAWAAFLVAARPETSVPEFEVSLSSSSGSKKTASTVVASCHTLPLERKAFLQLLLVRALRKDRLVAAMELYVGAVLGETFPWRGLFDLGEIIDTQSTAAAPLLLCSEAGHDASQRVDALAAARGQALASVAMGSAEGYETADRLISAGAQQGSWVLLRNIHLCPLWLEALEKRLHKLSPDPRFRLFLTSEIHPRLPPSLLRLSDVMVVEAPTGMKANVQRLLADVPAARMESGCAEKARLFFLVAWFHALVQERMRYLPWGWSRRYEFSQADAHAALDVVEGWLDHAAAATAGGGGGGRGGKGRTHISPEAIPWEAIRTLLSQSIYGGRVDNVFDQAVVEAFVSQFFRPECFDVDFALVEDGSVTMPDGEGCRAGYLSWLAKLPNNNPTTWLGLAPTVEAHLWSTTGVRVAGKVLQLQQDVFGTEEEEEEEEEEAAVDKGSSTAPAVLSKAVLKRVQGWLDAVGPVAKTLRKQQQAMAVPAARKGQGGRSSSSSSSVADKDDDVLRRCLLREAEVGKTVLYRVEADLQAACDYLGGKTPSGGGKATKTLRALVAALGMDTLPPDWQALHPRGDAERGAGAWVRDVVKRVEAGQALLREEEEKMQVWLGGLFFPEAFVTATRQVVAGRLQCSLEELSLAVAFGEEGEEAQAFAVTDLTLEGASWERGQGLALSSSGIRSPVPLAWLCWRSSKDGDKKKRTTKKGSAAPLTLPLYMDERRATLVAQVTVEGQAEAPWPQRGVALVAWRKTVV